MSDLLKRLAERRANVWENAKEHLDSVEERGGDLSGEDETKWTAFNTELTELDTRIEELRVLEERAEAADEVRERYGNPPAPTTDDRRDAATILAEIGRGERRGHTFELSERRALKKSESTKGEKIVPETFVDQLYQHLLDTSSIRQAGATVLTTDSGEPLIIPKTTGYSSAAPILESGTINDSDPTFDQVSLVPIKYGFQVKVSHELLTDSGVDLEGFLAEQGGRALGIGTSAHYITGNGTTQPQGVAGVASVGKTGATGVTGAFTGDDLIDLFYSVIAPYRAKAAWLMNDQSIADTRKMKDTNTGQYLWQPGLQAGEPAQLLGRPLYSDPAMASTGLDALSVLFGDFSTYYIRDVSGVRIERSEHANWDSDMVSFRFLMRTDGDLVDRTGSVKAFKGGAS